MKDADQNAEKEYNLIRMLAVTWTKSDLHGLGHFNLPDRSFFFCFLPASLMWSRCVCPAQDTKRPCKIESKMDSLFHKVFVFLFCSAYHCGENEFLLFSQMSFAAT